MAMTPPNKVGPNVLDRSANSLLAMVRGQMREKASQDKNTHTHTHNQTAGDVFLFYACNLGAHVPFFLGIH